jgi:hypothetical protein
VTYNLVNSPAHFFKLVRRVVSARHLPDATLIMFLGDRRANSAVPERSGAGALARDVGQIPNVPRPLA